jgi:predicted anti-sigma-YlaC factor YlaD
MCDEVRLALSAQLDGEAAGLDPAGVRGHLADCPDCERWLAGARSLTESDELAGVMRLRSAHTPDLTEQIMSAVARDTAEGSAVTSARSGARTRPGSRAQAAHAPGARAGDRQAAAMPAGVDAHARQQILRLAVAAAAVVQLALAIPALISAFTGGAVGVGLHASREMASFDVAVAVGFLLAAARPARARAFLPVAVVLAGCLAATSGIDLVRGATAVNHEIGHLVALAQAGLLWALTRSQVGGGEPPEGLRAGTRAGEAGSGAVTA